jgi:hypothetical protein
MNKQNKTRLQELERTDFKSKYPTVPDHAIPVSVWSDSTTNKLTKAVIAFINLSGYQAERINTTGRMIDNTKIVKDVVGFNRTIGSKKWIKGTGTVGSADISSTIHGRSVKIEIKFGKDRQSEVQKMYQSHIEKAGGTYVIVKTFDGFIEWYDNFIENRIVI